MDKQDLFRDVTVHLSANQEIEKGLQACFTCISDYIDADAIYLEKYEIHLGAMRLMAWADSEKCEAVNILIPLPEKAKSAIEKMGAIWKTGSLPEVYTVNNPLDDPIVKSTQESFKMPSSSILSLHLASGDQILGILALAAEGNDRFTEQDADLLSFLKAPFSLAMSNTLKVRELLDLKNLLADSNQYLSRELWRVSGDEIIGMDFGLKEVMDKVGKVAALDSPVLLLGETGTGKDVIANAIHYSSHRSDGPFIKVNCGAIPETLIDSELFGHEKGAFTGATAQKKGFFERADTGTIFLDEIGELPLQAQVRLLRVLQEKEIERIGGSKSITLDIRILAATNRKLEDMVEAGDFREDLWFRLNVFPVELPPLRRRKIDIPALLRHFILRKTKELKLNAIPRLEKNGVDCLMEYDWPGNVRELANVVERALILNQSEPLTFDNLVAPSKNKTSSRNPAETAAGSDVFEGIENLDELVSLQIQRILKKTNGKIHGPGGAAELLGINPNTLRSRMQKLGIEFGTFK